jgi:hypothetical protein
MARRFARACGICAEIIVKIAPFRKIIAAFAGSAFGLRLFLYRSNSL